jgi:hypothetical protein
MAIKFNWTQESPGVFVCVEQFCELRLIVTRMGDGKWDFNGHIFDTEALGRAELEVYATDAIARYGLSAQNKARAG